MTGYCQAVIAILISHLNLTVLSTKNVDKYVDNMG
jgi:hypothetical protein